MKVAEADSDYYLALLNYRRAPIKHGFSLSGMLFNRNLKTGPHYWKLLSELLGTCRCFKNTNQVKQKLRIV